MTTSEAQRAEKEIRLKIKYCFRKNTGSYLFVFNSILGIVFSIDLMRREQLSGLFC